MVKLYCFQAQMVGSTSSFAYVSQRSDLARSPCIGSSARSNNTTASEIGCDIKVAVQTPHNLLPGRFETGKNLGLEKPSLRTQGCAFGGTIFPDSNLILCSSYAVIGYSWMRARRLNWSLIRLSASILVAKSIQSYSISRSYVCR
jgi:hypothetical protein